MSDYEILCISARALIEARPDQVVTTGVGEFLRQCEAAKHKLAESKPQAGRGRLMVELGLKIADVQEGRYSVPQAAPAPEKEPGKVVGPHRNVQCPKCAEWIAMLASTPKDFDCPWCKTPLRDMGVHLHIRDDNGRSLDARRSGPSAKEGKRLPEAALEGSNPSSCIHDADSGSMTCPQCHGVEEHAPGCPDLRVLRDDRVGWPIATTVLSGKLKINPNPMGALPAPTDPDDELW
jgi:hypothetical protein